MLVFVLQTRKNRRRSRRPRYGVIRVISTFFLSPRMVSYFFRIYFLIYSSFMYIFYFGHVIKAWAFFPTLGVIKYWFLSCVHIKVLSCNKVSSKMTRVVTNHSFLHSSAPLINQFRIFVTLHFMKV